MKNRSEYVNRPNCCVRADVIHEQSNKQIFFVSTIFVFFLTSLYCIPHNVLAQETTENFLTYTNTDYGYGFTIKYPSDWIVNEDNSPQQKAYQVKFVSPGSLAGVTVTIENESRNEFENLSGAVIKGLPGLKLLEINTNTYFLSGHPAVRIVATGPINYNLKVMDLSTNMGGRTYDVLYASTPEMYANYLSIAQEMIDSFQAISRQ